MIKTSTLFLALLIAGSSVKSQTIFQKNFGGTRIGNVTALHATSDKGYVAAGYSILTTGYNEFSMVKFDSLSNISWTKTYGNPGSHCLFSDAIETSDGGYMLAGTSYEFGKQNMFFIKTDTNGDTLFTRVFGGFMDESASSIIQTSDGGYLASGLFTDNGFPANSSTLLYKMDAAGDSSWSKILSAPGSTSYEYAKTLKQTNDGGYIIAGDYSFGQFFSGAFLLKVDSAGVPVWNQVYSMNGVPHIRSVHQLNNNDFAITGFENLTGGVTDDIFCIRTNAIGDTLWTATYGESGIDNGGCSQPTTDGGFILAGHTENFGAASNGDAYLIKINGNGLVDWSKRYGGNQDDEFHSIDRCSDGGYIIGGITGSFGVGYMYLVKTDASGNSGCSENITATLTYHPTVTVSTLAITASVPPSIMTSTITTESTLTNSVHTACQVTTTVAENAISNPGFSVYPNPSSGIIHIQNNNLKTSGSNYVLSNGISQHLMSGILSASNDLILNLNILSPGIYYLTISNEKSIQVLKIEKL